MTINPDNGHGAGDGFAGSDFPSDVLEALAYAEATEPEPVTRRFVRQSTPSVPTDRVRLHVAMWRLANALGLGWTSVDAARPDHELLEEIAVAVTPALAKAYRDGFNHGCGDAFNKGQNPYDGIDL